MIGASFQTYDGPCQVTSPGVRRHARPGASQGRPGSHRLGWIAILPILAPLSFVLLQCGRAPSPGTLAANAQAGAGYSFYSRLPTPQVTERFPTAIEGFSPRQATDSSPQRTGASGPAPHPLACLAPSV